MISLRDMHVRITLFHFRRLPLSVLLLVTSDVPTSQLPPGAPEFLQHHGVGHALYVIYFMPSYIKHSHRQCLIVCICFVRCGVHRNIPLTPPNSAARRLAYEQALEHLNEIVPVPQPRQLNSAAEGQEDLALAPLTRNPAQEAAKAAREAMAGGNYVRAVGCLRRALSLNHNDRALKDMLKSAEAQVEHRE